MPAEETVVAKPAKAAAPRRPRVKAQPAPAETVPAIAEASAPAPQVGSQPAAAPPRAITDEDIRLRAYFLSIEHRGRGTPEYFWFLAERELRSRADRD